MNDRSFVAILLFGCALVIIALIWTAASLTEGPRSAAHPEDESVSNIELTALTQRIDKLSEQLSTGAVGAASVGQTTRTPTQPGPGEILTVWVDQEISLDPAAPVWDQAPTTTVALQRQDQTAPMLDIMAVDSIDVQSITNDRQIGWKLSWTDDTPRIIISIRIDSAMRLRCSFR